MREFSVLILFWHLPTSRVAETQLTNAKFIPCCHVATSFVDIYSPNIAPFVADSRIAGQTLTFALFQIKDGLQQAWRLAPWMQGKNHHQFIQRFRLNRPGNWFSSSLTFQEILLSKVKNITRCTLETWERTPPGESWRRPSTSLGESGMSGLQRGLQVDRQSSHLRLTPHQVLLLSWWTTRGTLRMQPGSLMVPECAGGE